MVPWKVEACNLPDLAAAKGFIHVEPAILPHCPTDVRSRSHCTLEEGTL